MASARQALRNLVMSIRPSRDKVAAAYTGLHAHAHGPACRGARAQTAVREPTFTCHCMLLLEVELLFLTQIESTK